MENEDVNWPWGLRHRAGMKNFSSFSIIKKNSKESQTKGLIKLLKIFKLILKPAEKHIENSFNADHKKFIEQEMVMNNRSSKRGKSNKMDFVSPFSKELDKIYEILDKTPEIRWERVEQLKKLIAAGKYHVPEEIVAEKMLQEFLAEVEDFND